MVAARKQEYSDNNVVDLSAWNNPNSDASNQTETSDYEASKAAARWETARWTKVIAVATCSLVLIAAVEFAFGLYYKQQELNISRQQLEHEMSLSGTVSPRVEAQFDQRLVNTSWAVLLGLADRVEELASEAEQRRIHASEYSSNGGLDAQDVVYVSQLRSASEEGYEQVRNMLPGLVEHMRELQALRRENPELFDLATVRFSADLANKSNAQSRTLIEIGSFAKSSETISFENWLYKKLNI